MSMDYDSTKHIVMKCDMYVYVMYRKRKQDLVSCGYDRPDKTVLLCTHFLPNTLPTSAQEGRRTLWRRQMETFSA